MQSVLIRLGNSSENQTCQSPNGPSSKPKGLQGTGRIQITDPHVIFRSSNTCLSKELPSVCKIHKCGALFASVFTKSQFSMVFKYVLSIEGTFKNPSTNGKIEYKTTKRALL